MLGASDWKTQVPSQRVLDACDKAGMTWDSSHAPDGVSYSGATQTAHLGGHGDWGGCHELAHWLLASPERRKLDEFGGGHGEFTAKGVELDVVLTGSEVGEDEQLAQALTVAILVATGVGSGHARRYGTLHMGTLGLDWAELRRRGLLSPTNMPVFLGDLERVVGMPGPQRLSWIHENSGISWWPAKMQRAE